MNETQRNCVRWWTKAFLIAAICIALIVGMIFNVTICLAIVTLLSALFFIYLIVMVIAERVYLWRVMGILTPNEWEYVRWYSHSLVSNGAEWIAECLREEEEVDEWKIELFERIEKNVKRPKLIS